MRATGPGGPVARQVLGSTQTRDSMVQGPGLFSLNFGVYSLHPHPCLRAHARRWWSVEPGSFEEVRNQECFRVLYGGIRRETAGVNRGPGRSSARFSSLPSTD